MSNADTLRVLNRTVERLNEAEDALFKASWERMCLLAERQKWKRRYEHTVQWYAQRLEPIKDVAKRVGVWDEVAAIIANGSGTRTLRDGTVLYDPPTYGQQLNRALHRAERAEAAAFKASWERAMLMQAIQSGVSAEGEAKRLALGAPLVWIWDQFV